MSGPERLAFRAARAVSRVRGRPALHPRGVVLTGRLVVAATGPPWGVAWLDRPGTYAVTARWSRAAGLPQPLPDGLGLALRIEDADGAGRPVDLLMTSSGRGRLARHVPLPRRSADAGPYSTLLNYTVGPRRGVIAAFPPPGAATLRADPVLVGRASQTRPLEFELCFGAQEHWHPLARLTLRHRPGSGDSGYAFDPYLTPVRDFGPGHRLRALRTAAYAGSRSGRHARHQP
ncbi:phosphodiesterase [Streptomyces sp. NPDC059071]|uniref:phosphodiesterase n=1 Tax=unclassified Streptomyces TaxID=2593676 RepID=UPI00364F968F